MTNDMQTVLNKLYRKADREMDNLNGFFGDIETPVVVDWSNLTYIVQHRLLHAHDLEGTCVKNRFAAEGHECSVRLQ